MADLTLNDYKDKELNENEIRDRLIEEYDNINYANTHNKTFIPVNARKEDAKAQKNFLLGP
jgi:hypothetical protein